MSKKYYCVTSSNKTGKMITSVLPCYSQRNPPSKYFRRLELHIDYFDDKDQAEMFAKLLRRANDS